MWTATCMPADNNVRIDAIAGLRVIYQDDTLLAIDKPAGLLVHPSRLDAQEPDDVVTRLRAVWPGTPPSPAHRLDKGTSGVLLLARDALSASRLGQAFAHGEVHKTYLALVRGWPADEGCTRAPLARDPELPSSGQPQLEACTHWRVQARFEWPLATRPGFATTRCALLQVRPETGRRHQIRRHFKQLGHPLIGDATHGKGPLNRPLAAWLGTQRLWLHAQRLSLAHPTTGQPLQIDCAPGPEWAALLAPTTSVVASGTV
jgi:tRNA pseudouridine65 synthase